MLLGEDGAARMLAIHSPIGGATALPNASGMAGARPVQLRRLREDDPPDLSVLDRAAANDSTGGRWSRTLRLTGAGTMVERSGRSTTTSMRHQRDVGRVDDACNGLTGRDPLRRTMGRTRHQADKGIHPTSRVLGYHAQAQSGFDLRLEAGSPAIDAGATTDAPSTDYDGNPRRGLPSGCPRGLPTRLG